MSQKGKRPAAGAKSVPKSSTTSTPTTTSTTTSSAPTPTRSTKQFVDATVIIDGILSQPGQPNKVKGFLDALNIVLSQLTHHHTKSQFITLTPSDANTYKKLFAWFLSRSKNIVGVDLALVNIITSILAYVIPLSIKTTSTTTSTTLTEANSSGTTVSPFEKAFDGMTKLTKKQQKEKKQADIVPTETVQYYIFTEFARGYDGKDNVVTKPENNDEKVQNCEKNDNTTTPTASLFASHLIIPLLTLINNLLPPQLNQSPIDKDPKNANVNNLPIINSLLTLLQQILKYATFMQNTITPVTSRITLITDSASIYIVLGNIFGAFVDQTWANIKAKSQGELIASTIDLISSLVSFNSPQKNQDDDDDEQIEKTQEQINNEMEQQEKDLAAQTAHINSSPTAAHAVCSIIFSTLSSIIVSKIQHHNHPLVTVFSTTAQGSKGNTNTAPGTKSLNYAVYETISHQVFNMAHYLTVCYVSWCAQHGIQTMAPQQQFELQASENNAYNMFINTDFLELLCLYLKHLDNAKLISTDDEQQSAIRRIMGVIMASGARCDSAMVFKSGYFEFLISLVWDQPQDNTTTTGKIRPSAVLLQPEKVKYKNDEQRQQIEKMYEKQVAIECNRISFFTLQLDIFILFASLGYSSRHLLINQYNFIEVLHQLLQYKVINIDSINRRQGTVVEKIALFMKNFISPMEVYLEFDYTMYYQMSGLSPFPELKQQTMQYLGVTEEELNKDENLQTKFETKIADDIYSVYLYDLYYTHQISRLFTTLYPSLCLYYNWPEPPDVSQITSGTTTVKDNTSTPSSTVTEDDKAAVTTTTTTPPSQEKAKEKENKAATFEDDMDQMVKYAMITGGIQQQDNNFIIASDLINFTTFMPQYHLFSFIPQHYTSDSTEHRLCGPNYNEIVLEKAFSPLQIAGFKASFEKRQKLNISQTKPGEKKPIAEDFNIETLINSIKTALKDNIKSVLIGLYGDNASNDDPVVILEKYYKKEEKSNDENNVTIKQTEQEIKIDSLVAQLLQFAWSLLNNVLNKKTDEIPQELKFVHFRHKDVNVDAFLKDKFKDIVF